MQEQDGKPKTGVLYVRVDQRILAGLDTVARRRTQRARGASKVSRADVVRKALLRVLDEEGIALDTVTVVEDAQQPHSEE